MFGGSAWTWSNTRKQFYLHQFTKQQPDLNYRNPKVVDEMSEVLNYYMTKGVAGFRLDAINHMFETKSLPDEPRNEFVSDPDSYEYYVHIHTKDLQETFCFKHMVDSIQSKTCYSFRHIIIQNF